MRKDGMPDRGSDAGRTGSALPGDASDRVPGPGPATPGRPADGSPTTQPSPEAVLRPVAPSSAGLSDGVRQDARVVPSSDVLDGVVEPARGRTGIAVPAGRSARRWPWAVAAAVAGAAAGAGVALLVQRLVGEDAPGAQEPEQLVAVVDGDAISARTDL